MKTLKPFLEKVKKIDYVFNTFSPSSEGEDSNSRPPDQEFCVLVKGLASHLKLSGEAYQHPSKLKLSQLCSPCMQVHVK
jgi:hypothetical protein